MVANYEFCDKNDSISHFLSVLKNLKIISNQSSMLYMKKVKEEKKFYLVTWVAMSDNGSHSNVGKKI